MRRHRKSKKYWTPAEDAIMRGHYPHQRSDSLPAMLPGRALGMIYQHAARLGLTKTDAYLASPDAFRFRRGYHAGWEHRFPKGIRPWNTGMKGWKAGGRSAETRFKKGSKPQTWKPVGTFRVSKDGTLQQKISDTGYPPDDWKSVHSLIWIKKRGPIPPGHIVIFRDGNARNFKIRNLKLISRADNMRRNSIHNMPQPLRTAVHLLGQLKRRIHERQNRGIGGNARGHDERSPGKGQTDGHRSRTGRRQGRTGDGQRSKSRGRFRQAHRAAPGYKVLSGKSIETGTAEARSR